MRSREVLRLGSGWLEATFHPLRMVALLMMLSPAAVAGQTGLLVVAHGADSTWNARVEQTVAQVSWRDGPVATAYLMGPGAVTSGWDAAVTRLVALGAQRIVVVPLMVSSFGGHYRQIEYYAGLRDSLPAALHDHDHATLVPPPVPAVVTRALDGSPELAAALHARWRQLDPASRGAPLLIVAHGPSDSAEVSAWEQNLYAALDSVPAAVQSRGVRVALLRDDAPPETRTRAVRAMRDTVLALAERSGDSVTVLPALISTGNITEVKIPRDLADLPIRYHRTPLTPLPALARWIERVARSATSSGRE